MHGSRLVIVGALLGSLFLAFFLSRVTASAAYAPQRAQAVVQAAVETKEGDEGCQVSKGYPEGVRQWCDWITKYARARSLAPDLVAAVIWLESGGNPEAYSRSGAIGLMQVMPRDGLAASFQCVNGPCFSDRPTIDELKDPEYNLAYGTELLADLIARHGDLRQALKAYGPLDVGYTYADRVLGIYQRFSGQ